MSGPKRLEKLDGVDLSLLSKIPGFPGYFINKEGEVFCVRRLGQFEDKNGYKRSWLYVNRKKKRPGIHVLLAKTYIPNDDEAKTEVRHLDGNNKNNRIENLAWGTRKENAEDMARHGSVRGSKNPRSILTEYEVAKIKEKLESGCSQIDIAKQTGVKKSTIQAIKSGRNWNHVKV